MFVFRLNGVLRQGNRERALYLRSDGSATWEKGKAHQFTSDEELENFLKNVNKEGHPFEGQKEDA